MGEAKEDLERPSEVHNQASRGGLSFRDIRPKWPPMHRPTRNPTRNA